MGAKRLEERFAYTGGKVDRTGPRPIIRDVLLCGPESANRRRYRKEAFAGDRVKKYDGRPVFLNHADRHSARRYEDRIAKVINPRHRADGMPIGDLEVRPKHPFAEAFLDDAEHDPNSVGMSHVAHCQTKLGTDGWEDVNALESVESVDVVLDPATTKGLHESTGSTNVAKISLKTFVERFGPKWGPAKWAAATKLCEDFGDMAAAPVMDEPPADAAEGDLKSGLMAALTPFLEEAFESGNSDKAVSALKDFIKLHAKHTGKAPDKEAPADDTAAEGKKPTLSAAVKECKDKGYTATTDDLAILTEMTSANGRAAYIDRMKTVAEGVAERPNSAGRSSIAPNVAATAPGSKPVTEAKAWGEGPKGYAEYIK